MARKMLVEVKDLTKVYMTRDGPVTALEPHSYEIEEGEFVSILGPSGCGKSTTLLIMAGLIPKSTGSVKIEGNEVVKPYTNVGIVFQDSVLLEWRKALNNIMMQIEIRGLEKSKYRPRAMELLKSVGLEGFEHKYPFELSGGMRQRVSICRALVHNPPVLLMDEPFSALDALTRDQLNLDLQKLWMEEKKTVVYVTHSVTEAVFLSDRVIVMSPRPGKIVETINIEIPRPRPLSIRETPEFGRYAKHIRRIFEGYGILKELPEGHEPVTTFME